MKTKTIQPQATSLLALKQRAHQLLERQRSLQQERDTFKAERDKLSSQHQKLKAARHALEAERNTLQAQLQELAAQRDSLRQERDTSKAERDKLSSQHQKLKATRDALEVERDTLRVQLQELAAQRESLQQERDTSKAERDELLSEHQKLNDARDELEAERDTLRNQINVLTRQNQDKILIRSALKHGFQELRSVLIREPIAITEGEATNKQQSRPQRLVKTIGTAGNLDTNDSHQFAASHALRHYASNTVCTYIPKNACTTLRYSIAIANGAISGPEDFPWIHSNNATFRAEKSEILSASYTFVILRNPFSRLVSFFLDKLAGGSTASMSDGSYKTARKLVPIPNEELTFRAFVSYLWGNPEKLSINHHIRPQVDFLLYEDYGDWFCVERLNEAAATINTKTGLQLQDTRDLSGHTSYLMEKINSDGLADLNVNQIRELRTKGQQPCPLAIYDSGTAFMVHAMYLSDVLLYNSRFGNLGELRKWLNLSRMHVCQ